jgi:hypothetical protein
LRTWWGAKMADGDDTPPMTPKSRLAFTENMRSERITLALFCIVGTSPTADVFLIGRAFRPQQREVERLFRRFI